MAIVVANSNAATAIAASEIAMTAIAASDVAMNAIVTSSATMTIVAASEIAMTAIAASEVAVNAIIANDTALTKVLSSSTAMGKIAASSTAMNKIAKITNATLKLAILKALNASSTIIKSAYSSIQNTSYFTVGTSKYEDGVTSLNSYTTTNNSFIACCLGTYSSSSAYTNLIYNGTTIKKGNSSRPTSVTSSNINAIGCTGCTFTETNDGYAAIVVYTAK